MKILKYKKLTNNRYKIDLDNNQELILYEEVILKYELLWKKEIDDKLYRDIEEENFKWDIYYVALKSLNNRYRSHYELRKLLLNKEYPQEDVDKILDDLEKQGYLNDDSFCKSYINNQIITTNRGPLRIKKDLELKGVSDEVINNNLDDYTKDLQLEKINKFITKSLKTNKTKAGNVLKSKIVNDLKTLGYSYEVISEVIDNYSFTVDKDVIKHEYDKLYQRLSKKYSGAELEYKIKEKLYQKGLRYED